MSLRSRLEARWYSAQRPPIWLQPLAALYGGISAWRRQRHTAGAEPLSVPVIVVGNISVGGTGKTPFVIWLVERLRSWGYRPGIISRGYGGRARQYPLRVEAGTTAKLCGDEPALMARRLGCPIAVAPRRVDAAKLLLAEGGVDILVADDGLQHYSLRRDLEICVVDARRGLGNRALLPAGPLREPPSRLGEVDCIIINGGGAGGLEMRLRMGAACALEGGATRELATFSTVHACAGIGHPQRFFSQLREFGLDVIEHPFPDHHQYQPADLSFDDDHPVLMTEKDAVKCVAFSQPHHWYVPVEAVLAPDAEAHVRKLVMALKH